ncbi:MAG: 2OG-Fe(II) oxygenase [Pseudomonadota bacterium]
MIPDQRQSESDADAIADALKASLAAAENHNAPYRHWILRNLLPPHILRAMQAIEFSPPDLDGVSGKRELHNDQRHYVDRENMARFPAMAALGEAFQSEGVVQEIAEICGADLDGTCLRIEYAVDATGFWLQPHTDLGVKRFTMLLYISNAHGQSDLGTDIYNSDKSWAKRTPFEPNLALVFVPDATTFHGFEPRSVAGVRKSLIVNYVTADWRDREQLAFPNKPLSL